MEELYGMCSGFAGRVQEDEHIDPLVMRRVLV